MGDVLCLLKNFSKALDCYQNALKYAPQHALASKKYAALYGELQKAGITYYDREHIADLWEAAADQYDHECHQSAATGSDAKDALIANVARICTHAAAKTLLMVCCGVGMELQALHRHVPHLQLVGLDQSPGILAKAQARCGEIAQFVHANAVALPFADQSYDIVMSISGLSAMADANHALSEMKRVCRKKMLIIEHSLEHLPPEGMERVHYLLSRVTWLHVYAELFQKHAITVVSETYCAPQRLTFFEVVPTRDCIVGPT